MWYFTWILGLLLACSLGIINVLRLEAQDALEKERIPLDPLTQLITKPTMLTRLGEKIENSRHNGFPFAVMVVSLEQFKIKYDLLDYEFDAVFRSVADYLKSELRGGVDIISRSGEHEFLIAMPGSSLAKANELAVKFKSDLFTQIKAPRDLTIEADVGASEYSDYVASTHNTIQTTTDMVTKLIQLASTSTAKLANQFV
jgi:cyd operon protein YbgT